VTSNNTHTDNQQTHLQQQVEAVNTVVAQQAQLVEAALTAQGNLAVDAFVASALAQAQVNAAGAVLLHAQQRLADLAGFANGAVESLAALTPTEVEPLRVLDLQVVPLALPEATRAALPPAARMLNASGTGSSNGTSKAAKRRARRTASQEAQD
jgi:hypothetical protein